MSDTLAALPVRSGQGDYQVEFFGDVAELAGAIPRSGAMVLADRRVAQLYDASLAPVFAQLPTCLVDATEDEKTLDGVGRLATWLQQHNATRYTQLVCVGGGIVQDLATFTAHVYYRGIKLVLVPTTLLSMSDSCIGAKCGINHNEFKNQLGVFHSPSRVLMSTRFAETLSDLDVASGYGEVLKLMLTGPGTHLQRLIDAVDAGGLRGPALPGLVRDSLEVKRQIIEADEYEADLRRVLNYGHTFGHSLEKLTAHAVPHGLAVAWGIDVVNYLAFRRGLLDRSVFEVVHAFVRRHLSCTIPRAITASELIAGARRDKKVQDGLVNLVLLERPGALRIVKTPFDDRLHEELTDYLNGHNAFASP